MDEDRILHLNKRYDYEFNKIRIRPHHWTGKGINYYNTIVLSGFEAVTYELTDELAKFSKVNNIIIGEGTKIIGSNAIHNMNIKTITLPTTLKHIHEWFIEDNGYCRCITIGNDDIVLTLIFESIEKFLKTVVYICNEKYTKSNPSLIVNNLKNGNFYLYISSSGLHAYFDKIINLTRDIFHNTELIANLIQANQDYINKNNLNSLEDDIKLD